MTGRTCWHCGGRTFALYFDAELTCMICGRPPLALMPLADAARLAGISPRTLARWVSTGAVQADPPTGSGRKRLCDPNTVFLIMARRDSIQELCQWCGRRIEAAGVRRGHKLSRRFCGGPCKSAEWRSRRGVEQVLV